MPQARKDISTLFITLDHTCGASDSFLDSAGKNAHFLPSTHDSTRGHRTFVEGGRAIIVCEMPHGGVTQVPMSAPNRNLLHSRNALFQGCDRSSRVALARTRSVSDVCERQLTTVPIKGLGAIKHIFSCSWAIKVLLNVNRHRYLWASLSPHTPIHKSSCSSPSTSSSFSLSSPSP